MIKIRTLDGLRNFIVVTSLHKSKDPGIWSVSGIDAHGTETIVRAKPEHIGALFKHKPGIFPEAIATQVVACIEEEKIPQETEPSPPSIAESVAAMVASREMRDAYIGCRRETFERNVKTFGQRRAIWLYRWDTSCDVVRAAFRVASPSSLMNLGSALLRYFT